MAKIMQVIEKKTNPSNGTVALKLYQTGFKTLTKLVGTKVGQTIANVTGGQELGYQMLQDNADRQMSVKTQLDKFTASYNSSINSKKSKVTGLFSFAYSFNSLYNYREELYEGMKADYNLLQKFVNAEKEMYDFTVFALQHTKRNVEVMREWSKNYPYGSCTEKASTTFDAKGTIGSTGLTSASGGISASVSGASSKVYVSASGLKNIALGATAVINGWYKVKSTEEVVNFTRTITRNRLGTTEDDGYFTGWNFTLNGLVSPHFADSSGIYDYKFFNSRKLI